MMSVNAFATLLEYFIKFFPTKPLPLSLQPPLTWVNGMI